MCDVFAIYDNNISPSLLMIILKIIILYFIQFQIRHTDNFPPTGTPASKYNWLCYNVHATQFNLISNGADNAQQSVNSIQFITFYLPVRWVKYLVDSEIHSNYRQSGDSH